jgi:hypothetical protein
MSTQKERLYQRIEKHGYDLIAIFSLPPISTDPIKLCKQLRRAELKLNAAFTKACNQEHDTTKAEAQTRLYLTKILGPQAAARIRFNHDPRGYALKIDLEPGQHLYRDWGGYGIIAPDLTND